MGAVETVERVTLTPDRGRAAAWTVVGLVATSLAAYTFGSSEGYLLSGLLVAACAVPTGVFGLQLLAPEAWTLEVDRDGLRGTIATFRVDQPFAPLRAVELRQRGGDAVLVLIDQGHRRRLLLPVGCDLPGLAQVLQEVEHAKARGL